MAGRDLDRGRLLLPNPITVTLTRPLSTVAGPLESVTVNNVQDQAEEGGQVDDPLGGSMEGAHRAFTLWAIECSGLEPGEGWLITRDDGTVFRITNVDRLAHGRRFRCHTVKKQV